MAKYNEEIVKQSENNIKTMGFASHPENINRNGRPKTGQALTDIMREVLEEDLPSGKKRKEALVRRVLELAYEGNEAMIRMAWSYLEGMPVQRNVLAGDEENPVVIDIKKTLEKIYGSPGEVSTNSKE